MPDTLELIATLTQSGASSPDRRRALRQFAVVNGWRPSDEIDEYPGVTNIANGHLVVEHGLDNTAVITFLTVDNAYPRLSVAQRLRVLGLSYNNLVDWHLFPDLNGLTVVFNRSDLNAPLYYRHADHSDVWRANAFEGLVGRRPVAASRTLDDALIDTISFWKRALHSDLGPDLRNESISALFNAVLFIRSAEDHRVERWANGRRLLMDVVTSLGDLIDLRSVIIELLRECGVTDPSFFGTTPEALEPFTRIPRETALQIARDFYINKYAPYEYDFSVISKHALSRIYEHYISLLRDDEPPQPRLFGALATEISTRTLGGIYTPQYIARFFARFIKDNVTPKQFRSLRYLDPACGSGIFLRSLLELQCDPLVDGGRADVDEAFNNIMGVDVDPSACHATKLSLALLYLTLTGQFPKKIDVINAEAIDFFLNQQDVHGTFGALTVNPPFIKWDRLSEGMRRSMVAFLGDDAIGKTDAFVALLALGLILIKPGGFLLYVLPHSFLLARNGEHLRTRICETCAIRMVVDLSQIPVFEGIGSYVVLLIVEKRGPHTVIDQPAIIVTCRDAIGNALQDALEGRLGSYPTHSVYQLSQEAFAGDNWELLSPLQFGFKQRLSSLPRLDDFADVREGLVTGADDVFIRLATDVPHDELQIYPWLLTDREMRRFSTPTKTENRVFYPFVNGRRLTEDDVRLNYPKTWQFLTDHADKLKSRASVVRGTVEWWAPERPRRPRHLMRPKIIAPHLVLVPRFGIDLRGKFAVTRAPIIYPKDEELGDDVLLILCAILNSSVVHWQLTLSSHRYSHGYLMLEPKTLKNIRIPEIGRLPHRVVRRITETVQEMLKRDHEEGADIRLNALVAEAYGISPDQLAEFGLD